MDAPGSPRDPSPPTIAISTAPPNPTSRKRKHIAISGTVASSPAPSDSGATPGSGTENVILPTRHFDLSTRPRLEISRHPLFVPLAPGSPYLSTEPLCINRLNFRYTPAGLTPHESPFPFRTIESAPATFRVSWEDRSTFIGVTQDGLGLEGQKGFRSARCNAPLREGKWYMEVKIDLGGGEKATDSQRREGSHVRLGWARREAPLNGPVGLDGYSYGFRDKTGEKVHLSRPRPYGKSFKSGDVIGMYISLPSPKRQPDRKDPYDPAHIKRERIAIEFKGQEYFESLEYSQSKEMIALMDANDRAKATNTASMPSSATKKSATVKNLPSSSRGSKGSVQEPVDLRPLPTLGSDSHIAFFVNGECQGVAYQDLFDYLPLRMPPNKRQEKKKTNKEGFREHKENPYDDGTLGYYPFISLFNGARVRMNPGPDFDFPPPPDIDSVLSSVDPLDTDVKPLQSETKRTWRPMFERYPEYIAEQRALDDLEAAGIDNAQQGVEQKEKGKVKPDAEKLEAHRAKRRAQAAARREKRAKQAKEEAELRRRQLEEAKSGADASISIGDYDRVALSTPSPDKSSMLDQSPRPLGIAAYSPAPTVASSVDVQIPGVVSRQDSSAYNSDEEMDANATDPTTIPDEITMGETTYVAYRDRDLSALGIFTS